MKRKIAILLAVCLCMLSLTACSFKKDPTAEELAASVLAMDETKYNKFAVDMTAELVTDDAPMTMSFDATMESAGDIVHMYDMAIQVGMSGLSLTIDAEIWQNNKDLVSYTNVGLIGEESGWQKADMDNADGGVDNIAGTIDGSDVTMAKHAKGEDYIITWPIDLNELSSLVVAIPGEENFPTEGSAVGQARFDESTHDLKSISAVFDDGAGTKFNMEITVIEMNGDAVLEIPTDIIDSAQDVSDTDGLVHLGQDDLPEDADDSNLFDNPSSTGMFSSGIETDGAGEDEYIDGLAERINAANPDNKGIELSHYGSMNYLYYRDGDDSWYGTMSLWSQDESAWGPVVDEYEEQCDWLASWYGREYGEAAVEGDAVSGNYIIYCHDDENRQELDYAGYFDNVMVEVSIYVYYKDSGMLAMDYLDSMLADAGLQRSLAG